MKRHLIRTAQRLPLWGRIAVLYGVTAVAVLIGIALLPKGPEVRYEATLPPAVAAQTAVVQAAPVTILEPNRLTIDRLRVDLNVRDGYYDAKSKTWTLSDTEAFFATVSDRPSSNPGSTFIYGHNRPNAFGPLANLGVNDTVQLSGADGTVFTYAYVRDARVVPEATDILTADSDVPQLILMTCDGIFNEVRRVMYFSLIEVSS